MNKNIGLKLFVLFISMLLWFQQTLLQEHTVDINIPFKIKNIPSNLTPQNIPQMYVKASIKARGIDIFLLKYLKVHFIIDASNFHFGPNSVSLNLSNLTLPEHMNIKIEDLQVKNRINIYMDGLTTKKKPIHLNYASVKDLEYFLNNKIDMAGKKVKVRGPVSAVKDLDVIESEKISRKMVKNGVITVRLIPPSENIVLLQPELTFRVIEQRSIDKTISLIPISFPQDKKVTLIPQKVTVMIRGPQSLIEKINEKSITPYVDEKDLNKNGFATVKFRVPQGVIISDYTPRQVQVLVNE